ncbi:MAG: M56 family metallopeptidase [Candidatus Faecousia sp.]|nr:M56 family metallopeptidase [Candidatus Faecousia sp.]
MTVFFAGLVKTAIGANWLILAAIFLRFLLKKAPRRVTCLLWAIVALRLVLPVSIESPVSLIPQTTVALQEAVDTSLIHVEAVPPWNGAAAPLPTAIGTAQASEMHTLPLATIWAAGMAVMLGYLLISYFRMRYLVREAVQEEENIWMCDGVTSPFILGVFRPRIYLPSGLSGSSRAYVIAHEKSHLCCKDHLWKPFAFCLLAMYWFDPLVWAAYWLACRDIEFACDERVIRALKLPERKAYASALLACSDGRKRVLVCPVAFGETAVVQRIRSVLNYKRPSFWAILVAVILILALAIGFLTVPKSEPKEALSNSSLEESVPPETILETQTPAAPAEESSTEVDDPEWTPYPDGIRIDTYEGENFTAQIMLVRDPSRVYLATSSETLSKDTPGLKIDAAIEKEGAVAAINAGTCWDDGTGSLEVGSVPLGLNLSKGKVVWDSFSEATPDTGFVGFNRDNILIVANSVTEEEALELGIRDGCASGTVLIVNGNAVDIDHSGYSPRTAIGQRADGTVILVCTNGRTDEYIGATLSDVIDILQEYGAVNACALLGGSSANMLYRDTQGLYGETGTVHMFNPESAEHNIFTGLALRRLPTFWMVKP